jgi:hypothetical protein
VVQGKECAYCRKVGKCQPCILRVSTLISDAILFLTCILSELESKGRYPAHPKLQELWVYGRELNDEAEELWRLRYRSLLKARDWSTLVSGTQEAQILMPQNQSVTATQEVGILEPWVARNPVRSENQKSSLESPERCQYQPNCTRNHQRV